MLFYLLPKGFLDNWAILIFIILKTAICLLVLMQIKNNSKFKSVGDKLESEIRKILNLKEDIEEDGVVIRNRDLKANFSEYVRT